MPILLLLACHPPEPSPPSEAPHVVLLLADDQRVGLEWAMPELSETFFPEARAYTRAYVTSPLCCPMRASLLSGGFSLADTHVTANNLPDGGAARFDATVTLATRLQDAGVATAVIGKYLNDYEATLAPEVPPGWDTFAIVGEVEEGRREVFLGDDSGQDAEQSDVDPDDVSDWIFDQARAFLDTHADEPTFLLLAPMAPHLDGQPLEEDAAYADYEPTRAPSWNEEDVSDKPGWIQRTEPTEHELDVVDRIERQHLSNLAELDAQVSAFYADVPEGTLFVYGSDNGYLYGEHRLHGKGLPYEESVRVPLYLAGPGVPTGTDTRLVAANLDLPATVSEWLGAEQTGEGSSLLAEVDVPIRDELLIEGLSSPSWASVVTEEWKYVEWYTGEIELYDLEADPYELESQHADPPVELQGWRDTIASGRALVQITPPVLPEVAVGEPFAVQFEHRGGVEPVMYSATGLPEGVTLDPDGTLTGVPAAAGVAEVEVRAEDSSESAWNGEPQVTVRTYVLRVTGPEAAVAEPEAERVDEGTARVRVTAPKGAHIRVEACHDRTFDGRRSRAEAVSEGQTELRLEGLDGLRWFYRVWVDGRLRAEGEVR